MGGNQSTNNPDYNNVSSNAIPGLRGDASNYTNIRSVSQTRKCHGHEMTLFSGDPKTCCVMSPDVTGNLNDGFSDPAQQQTCAPQFRNINGPGCEALFNEFCLNTPCPVPENCDSTFLTAWQDPSNFCQESIKRHVRTQSGEINQAGLPWARNAMNSVFQKYFGTVGGILPPGQSGQFQDLLYQLCLEVPEACETALDGVCTQETRESAGGNDNVANLCGCHMQESVYARYENLFGIPRQCDPICARPMTVPMTNEMGQTNTCQNSVCIIDNITFDLADTQAGDINFTQACGACTGTAACICQISGFSLRTAEAQLGNVDLSQFCEGALQCFRQNPNDPNGRAVQVNCDEPDDFVPNQNDTGQQARIDRFITIALVIILILATIFAIIILFVQGREQSQTVQETQIRVSRAPRQTINSSSLTMNRS